MSDRQQTSSSNRITPPSTPEAENSDSDTSSLPGGVFYCSCGEPDSFENWICCDSESCSIRWYHWQCVGVTYKPCGYWLCPRCRQESPPSIRERRSAQKALWSVTAKRTPRDRKNTLSDGGKDGTRASAKKTPVRSKKGIAVKKAPSKKRAGWVETDSEGEEEDEEEPKRRAQRAGIAAKTRRKMAQATKSRGRVTKSGAVQKTSTKANGAGKKIRLDVLEDVDEVDSNDAEDAETKVVRARTTSRRE